MKKHSYSARRAAAKTVRTARRERLSEHSKPFLVNGTPEATAATPFYDSELRELRVGTILVKCFMQESDAQEVIVASFQEENWCRCIDDPLPLKDDQDPKRRLRRAVENLNRRQRVPLLHFRVIFKAPAWPGTSFTATNKKSSTTDYTDSTDKRKKS